MANELKFSDSVWHRVINAFQEAILTGVECSDVLRQIRVVPDASDPHVLVLSPEYEKQVRDMHAKMLEEAQKLQVKKSDGLLVGKGSPGDAG